MAGADYGKIIFYRYGAKDSEHLGDFRIGDDLVASIWRKGNIVGISGYHIGREFEGIGGECPFGGFTHKTLTTRAIKRMKELTA